MKNLVFNLRTAKAQAEGCAKVSRMAKVLTTLTLLLTLGVGQVWADDNAGFYEVYMTYSYNGTSSNYTYRNSDSGNSSIDLGTLTADFQITSIYWKFWYLNNDWNRSGNVCGGLLGYNLGSGDQEWTPSLTWNDKGWDSGANNRKKECYTTTTKTIAQYNSGPSGSYTFSHWFKGWGSVSNGSDCYSQWYINNGGGNYSFTYKIAPPAVSGFGVSTSGYLAGRGTEEDPYLVKSGNSLTFTVSGSKARTDDNSTFNYWLNSGAKQTSGTLSTGSITSSDLQSAVIHGQCINNSSSSLVGTESTSTIYYKAVSVKDITVYIYVGGCTEDQINSLVLTGTPYVGSKALSGVHITPAGWKTDGNWRSYTFSNVTKVHNLQVAGMGGAIPLKNIENATEDFYYRMFDGTELDYRCVSAPKLTWTTAPVDAKVGVHMKAVVNTTPVSGGSPRVTWYTSNSNIAAVNESTGEISYKAAGDVTITAHVTWDVSGDYCAGSSDLKQTITVIAPEITAATFVQNPILTTDHLQVSISYRHIPAEGCYIRLKQGDGYYMNEHNESYIAISEGSGNLIFTTLKTEVPSGVWTVEIWNQAKDKLLHSRDVEGSLTVKTGHTITVTAGANGAVSPSTVYAGDGISSANFTATPNTGYEFIGWTKTEGAENFTLNSPSSETTHVTTASSNGTVRADFRGKSYTLTLQNTGHGRIISSPEGTARTGETVTITPTPDSGYEFDYIEVNGVSQGSGVTTFTMPGADVTVTAHFKLHSPELGAVTATLSGQQNYGELPIDFALSVTSTYLPNPVVVFLVNDGETTYEVVGAPYGANGNDAAGTIGPDPIYTTVHKATFTASAAKTYTVSAKLYEGLLLANWDGKDFTGGKWEGSNGHDLVANPNKQAVNGSNYVRQFKKGGDYWVVDLYRFAGANQGIATFRYAHTRQYRTEVGKTWLKLNDGKGDIQKDDNLAANTWQKVVYDNGAGTPVDFFFPLLKEGNTSVYFDDIILSNEETMTEKATAAAPASFSINTVTLNNNDATTPGTESVIVTYGSALSNITVPSKTDYTFYGYYTENAGEGRQLINDAGEWIASVDGYTNENKKWVHDGNVTLYAYYKKAQITRITFSPGNIVAPGATVTVTATVEPEPAGETTICWRVLYSNDNPLASQPKFTPAEAQGKSVSFIAPEASGSYKVEATLRKGTGCGGEEIHTFTAPFQVAGDHTVTVQYKCGDVTLQGSTSVSARQLDWSGDITAPTITGYTFTRWEAGDGITIKDGETNSNPTHIKAIYDGKLTAIYTKKNMIYFNNTLGWSAVYVYFYENNKYWGYEANAGKGTGSNPKWRSQDQSSCPFKHKGAMTQIKGTNIWYYDCEANSINASYTNVAFNEKDQTNYDYFSDTKVVRRGDYHSSLPMFVPLTGVEPVKLNQNKAEYYNEGYWMNYPENTGYSLHIYKGTAKGERDEIRSIAFPFTADKTMPMEVTLELNANTTYGYEIHRADNTYHANDGTIKINASNDIKLSDTQRGGIKTSAAGDYVFKLNFGNSSGYGYLFSVQYPASEGSYRLVYKDLAEWSQGSAHTDAWSHPSRVIYKNEGAADTVSFFVAKGHTPTIQIQKITSIDNEGNITWENVGSATSYDTVSAAGVYNFITSQTASALSIDKVEPYTGNYYIRTDNAGSTKWDNYRAADHQMTYSEFSKDRATNTFGELYTHYYMHWCPRGTNVKFCIANDYSSCITDTLVNDVVSLGNMADAGWLNRDNASEVYRDKFSANIRFMYDERTNKISRAYMSSSTNTDRKFLVLKSNTEFWNSDGTALSGSGESAVEGNYEAIFKDNEDWIYEREIKLTPGQKFKLYASYAQATAQENGSQHFCGNYAGDDWENAENYVALVGGNGDACNVRIIYDFKTNRLLAAMVQSGEISTEMDIYADVMFIREHQGDIEQLIFNGSGKITNIKTAYGVMRFNKWTLNNKDKDTHNPLAASIYERAMYFISFPFEVKLSEVFGFGTYGQDWIIEYYDGAERARTGWWEGQPGFWRYVWDRKNFVLKPNVGYLLELELGNFKEGSGFWNNKNERLELFFPSSGPLESITNATVNCSIPEHACTINRAATEGLPDTPENPRTSYNRTIFDSHWNVMSVPTYVNATPNEWSNTTWTTKIGPKFLYTWNMEDNTLTATSAADYRYHAMHAYMVQYGGNVQWVTSGTKPAAIVARNTYAEEPKEVEFRLEIQQNEKMVDQTFVIMSNDDQINANFQFGEDMSKDFNARNANIYTMTADNVAAAGNSLPMSENTTIVPVGVSVKKTGDYTFSIPDGTNGVGITLIDEETGIRTSLSALDYTVNLAAGDYTERFWLEISPIYNTPTGIEEPISDSSLKGRAQKRIIDGVLYIVKDGKIFDARGTRVE